jgi:hypothetical protein
MLGLVFYFEDFRKNVYSGRSEADVDIWRDTSKIFECSHLFMIDNTSNNSGVKYIHNDLKQTYQRFTTLEELEATFSEATFVYTGSKRYLDKEGVSYKMLPTFEHPQESVIYVMGADSGIPSLLPGREDKLWVSVPSRKDGDTWSLTFAAVILYDRYVRTGKWQSQ